MPSGPVRVGARIYLPVVDATRQPWEFSVFVLSGARWSRVGAPLNQGSGNAQGVLRVNNGSIWAAWQEHLPRSDGRFDTRIYVEKLTPSANSAKEVWAGTSIGPGGRGLTVRVRPLGPFL